MCFRRFFSLLVVLGLNSWPHACWHSPWPLCCISSPLRLTFNCYSGKNFTTNGRNILKTLPALVLTCAFLVRAGARKPLVSSPWKTAPLFFLHTMCFLKVQPHFNSRRPTSLLSSPFFQSKVQCCHQPAFAQDSPEGGVWWGHVAPSFSELI